MAIKSLAKIKAKEAGYDVDISRMKLCIYVCLFGTVRGYGRAPQ